LVDWAPETQPLNTLIAISRFSKAAGGNVLAVYWFEHRLLVRPG